MAEARIVIHCYIYYHSEYGEVPPNGISTSGATLTVDQLPTLTSDGAIFIGWYSTETFDEGTEVQAGYVMPETDLYLYAKWKVIGVTVHSKLTAIADEIRTLSGTTEAMGLDAMATNVGNANSEIVDQNGVLEQIKSALEGKSVSGGGSVETCTVEIILPANTCLFGWGKNEAYLNGTFGGEVVMPSMDAYTHYLPVDSSRIFRELPVGSTFAFYSSDNITGANIEGDIEFQLVNPGITTITVSKYAMCKCNGSGSIAINV